MRHWLALLLSAMAGLAGCQHRPAPVPVMHTTRYVVGPAWQGAGGAWFYPREQSSFEATGLAVIDTTRAGTVMADGASFDPQALTASVQTLPLPAVLRVRDLETGRSLYVRAIGRGPDDPGRLIALSPAAARLLGMRAGVPAQVSVSLDQDLTQQMLSSLTGAPRLAIAQAPVGAVTEQPLGPPGSAPGSGSSGVTSSAHGSDQGSGWGSASAGGQGSVLSGSVGDQSTQPVTIPTGVQQGPVMPGELWIDGGRFDGAQAANTVASALGGEAQRQGSGRQAVYRVLAGPFRLVSEADAALDRARHAGVTGAHIIVE